MKVFVLIDCNNFFVSCERAFRPDLKDKPVIVLSSNDGCIVSRSNEVKALGIKMGTPRFQIKNEIAKHKINIFSSNFALYGNLSQRVMNIARDFAAHQEIYSIDECFLEVNDTDYKNATDWENFGLKIKNTIQQATGIPVTVGIAPSKTLAKLATEIAKKDPFSQGALSFTTRSEEQINSFLQTTDINQIWGVGRQTAKYLFTHKIFTAAEFTKLDLGWVKKHLKSNGEKIWLELHGQPCVLQEDVEINKKQLLCSRSFAEPITDLNLLKKAVSNHIATAAQRLRKQKSRTSLMTIFISTSRFIDPQYRHQASQTIHLSQSTAFTPDLISMGMKTLEKIYQKGFAYKKAGVIFSGLECENNWQPELLNTNYINEIFPCYQDNLFYQTQNREEESSQSPTQINFQVSNEEKDQKQIALMKSLDQINHQYGHQTIRLATQGYKNKDKLWTSSARYRSPNYLSSWNELPLVK